MKLAKAKQIIAELIYDLLFCFYFKNYIWNSKNIHSFTCLTQKKKNNNNNFQYNYIYQNDFVLFYIYRTTQKKSKNFKAIHDIIVKYVFYFYYINNIGFTHILSATI